MCKTFGVLQFVPHLFNTIQSWTLCECESVCLLLHSPILERRRSAALCMMKPCIGYDFFLAHIHIHAQLPGRVCKIEPASLTASAPAPAVPSPPPTPFQRGLFFFISLSGAASERGPWSLLGASGSLRAANTKRLSLINPAIRILSCPHADKFYRITLWKMKSLNATQQCWTVCSLCWVSKWLN